MSVNSTSNSTNKANNFSSPTNNTFLQVPDGFTVEISQDVNPAQLGSEFYCGDGVVLSLGKPNRFAQIVAEGELRVYLGEDYFKNGMASKEFRSREMTDEDLRKLGAEDAFINCNWFNIYLGKKANKCVISAESVCSTLTEALAEAIDILNQDESEWLEDLES